MKKLLNTLFILTDDYYLSLEGESVVITEGREKIGQFPLHIFEGIISFSYSGASPELMGACAANGIGFAMFTPYGKFLCRVEGRSRGNILLRKEQYRISDDERRSLPYARNMVLGKVFNERWTVDRTLRDYPMRVNGDRLRESIEKLKTQVEKIRIADSVSNLRGVEGDSAVDYFRVFNDLILNQKDDFCFSGRNRRPPLDKVNAMLSFAYTLLANDCMNALESVGLDSYAGFMHTDKPGRASLALDLEEELRAPMADRFVLTMINKKMLTNKSFSVTSDGAVLMTDDSRKIFLAKWQERKKEEIVHPYLQEKVKWGLVPYIQALLLSRTIRGDLDEYPPFMWK